jgi:hypothetical protein
MNSPSLPYRLAFVPKFIWHAHKKRVNFLRTLKAIGTLLLREQTVYGREK